MKLKTLSIFLIAGSVFALPIFSTFSASADTIEQTPNPTAPAVKSNTQNNTQTSSFQPTVYGSISQNQEAVILKKGGAVVGRHTYTISKGTINTVKDLGAIAGGGYLATQYPALAPIAIPVAEYAVQKYKIKHELRVKVVNLKNTSGGVSTAVESYSWVKV